MLKFLQLLMRMLLESYIDGGTLCGIYEVYIYIWILLTCALRAHNNIPFLEKILLEIEKVLTVF